MAVLHSTPTPWAPSPSGATFTLPYIFTPLTPSLPPHPPASRSSPLRDADRHPEPPSSAFHLMLYPSTHQAHMDTADWLKAIVQDEAAPMIMDSSTSPSSSADFLQHHRPPPPPPPPPPPMLERRLRPPHDQPLKCPRCDSTHTKFCYYNNYSLSQPRYFCKTCRRYWTKGGSLRNVPVGGGCRKNKRSGGAKKTASVEHPMPIGQFPPPLGGNGYLDMGPGSTELHLSTLSGLLPPLSNGGGPRGLSNFMECKYGSIFDGTDVSESKFGGILADPRGQFLMGFDGNAGGDHGAISGFGEASNGFGLSTAFGGVSPLGFSMDVGSHNALVENCQRLALPWNGNDDDAISTVDTKPDSKMLTLEWQEQCGEVGREPFAAYAANGVGVLWGAGVLNNHQHVGSSAANNHLI